MIFMLMTTEFKCKFQALVKRLKVRNLKDCATIVGVTQKSFFNAYEHGIFPSIKTTVRIADFFNVSIDYLLGLTTVDSFVKSDNPTTLCQRLKQLQPTQPKEARRMLKYTKVGYKKYTSWKQSSFPSKWEYVVAIADYHNVSLDYLLGRTDVRCSTSFDGNK